MRCRRATDLAADEIMNVLRRFLHIASGSIAVEFAAAGVVAADVAAIMRDFAAARQHMYFIFCVKFSYWRQLPMILFGIAHRIIPVAKSCAQRALQLFHVWIADHGDARGFPWVAVLLLS